MKLDIDTLEITDKYNRNLDLNRFRISQSFAC